MDKNTILTSYELPIEYIKAAIPDEDIGFCIGSYVLKHPIYADYYAWKVASGRMVILDNGLHEDGHSMSINKIKKAINILGARPNLCVIAPDKLHDGGWTLKHTRLFAKEMKGINISIAAVAQGYDLMSSYVTYVCLDDEGYDLLCLPFKADRPNFLRQYTLNLNKPHHLLGSYGLDEIKWLRRHIQLPSHTSIDTAKPIKAGIAGHTLLSDYRGTGLWKVDQSLTEYQIENITSNIHIFNQTCRGAISKSPSTYQKP